MRYVESLYSREHNVIYIKGKGEINLLEKKFDGSIDAVKLTEELYKHLDTGGCSSFEKMRIEMEDFERLLALSQKPQKDEAEIADVREMMKNYGVDM